MRKRTAQLSNPTHTPTPTTAAAASIDPLRCRKRNNNAQKVVSIKVLYETFQFYCTLVSSPSAVMTNVPGS
jgi:hypothetical protein